MQQKADMDDDSVPRALAERAGKDQPVLLKYSGAVHIGADLTLYQRRAFNVLLYWAMAAMPKTTRHEIDLDELAWGMGLERASQRMERLVENLNKMMEARVVWNLLDDQGGLEEWESATLLPYVKVSRKTRTVTYEFTRAFQERVYNPSEFAEIALRMQRVFRSEHALALYENARRFLPAGETPWIPIDTFRSLMGIQDKPYYDEYKYLNARLIKPAMDQVNTCSDIELKLKTKRLGRAVNEIKFLVSANAQMTLFAESLTQELAQVDTEAKRRLLLRLSGYRISGKRAEQLLEHHSESRILAALDAAAAWMEAKESNRESIVNPAGVAFKAITEGWVLPCSEESIDSEDRGKNKSSAVDGSATARPERLELLRAEFKRRWYRMFVASANSETLGPLKIDFEAFLEGPDGDAIALERYRKNGLTGIALGVFQSFLAARGIGPSDREVETYLRKCAFEKSYLSS
jgi:plasmid replication initiation protein